MAERRRRRLGRTLARRPSGARQRREARDRGTPELQRHRAARLGLPEDGSPAQPRRGGVDESLAESALGRLQARGLLDEPQVQAGRRYFVLYRIWLGGWSVRAAPLGDWIPAWDNSDPLDTAGVEQAFKAADDLLRAEGVAVRRATRATVLGDLDPPSPAAAAAVAEGLERLAVHWQMRRAGDRREGGGHD